MIRNPAPKRWAKGRASSRTVLGPRSRVSYAPEVGIETSTVGLAQPRECRGERLHEPHGATLLLGQLRVVTPIRPLGQYRLHHSRLQIPVTRRGLAQAIEKNPAAEFAQPGGEQQRLDLVPVHVKIPAAQAKEHLTRGIVRGGYRCHQRHQVLGHQ